MPSKILDPETVANLHTLGTRTVVPGKEGEPGHVRIRYCLNPAERARYRAAAELEEAGREENIRHYKQRLVDMATAGDGVSLGETGVALKTLCQCGESSLTDLAAKAGMQKSSLSRLENEDRNPTVRTLERIAAALGKRLVVRIEDLPEPVETPNTPETPETPAPPEG